MLLQRIFLLTCIAAACVASAEGHGRDGEHHSLYIRKVTGSIPHGKLLAVRNFAKDMDTLPPSAPMDVNTTAPTVPTNVDTTPAPTDESSPAPTASEEVDQPSNTTTDALNDIPMIVNNTINAIDDILEDVLSHEIPKHRHNHTGNATHDAWPPAPEGPPSGPEDATPAPLRGHRHHHFRNHHTLKAIHAKDVDSDDDAMAEDMDSNSTSQASAEADSDSEDGSGWDEDDNNDQIEFGILIIDESGSNWTIVANETVLIDMNDNTTEVNTNDTAVDVSAQTGRVVLKDSVDFYDVPANKDSYDSWDSVDVNAKRVEPASASLESNVLSAANSVKNHAQMYIVSAVAVALVAVLTMFAIIKRRNNASEMAVEHANSVNVEGVPSVSNDEEQNEETEEQVEEKERAALSV